MERDKIIRVAVKMMEKHGCEIISTDSDQYPHIVAMDGDVMVFCEVNLYTMAEWFPEQEGQDRRLAEIGAGYWLAENEVEVDRPLRFDAIEVVNLGNNKGMVRRIIGLYGGN